MTENKRPTRVLIVDDNEDAATSLGILLNLSGYEVLTSFDGPTALAKAEQFLPDACVVDINMPGMNGYEVARCLLERMAASPPVLATVTAYGDCDHLDRALDAGFVLHFTKPADPLELATQLELLVAAKARKKAVSHNRLLIYTSQKTSSMSSC